MFHDQHRENIRLATERKVLMAFKRRAVGHNHDLGQKGSAFLEKLIYTKENVVFDIAEVKKN